MIYTSSKMMLVGYDDVQSKVMSIKEIITESRIVPTADAGTKTGSDRFFSVIDDVLQKCRQV